MIVVKAPITERYWRVGSKASVDVNKRQIKVGGCWFPYKIDEWELLQPYTPLIKNGSANSWYHLKKYLQLLSKVDILRAIEKIDQYAQGKHKEIKPTWYSDMIEIKMSLIKN